MQVGTIIFHRDFVFHDGGIKDKYLVVLGFNAGVAIVAKTTSNSTHFRLDFGCQSANRYPAFYLPKGCCCLPKDTWICLDEFYELSFNELQQRIIAGVVNRYGLMNNLLTRDIQFCAKSADDIAGHQEKIIDLSLATVIALTE